MKNRTYIAIDLKSFYASVECIERGLDPLKANLVVADASRSEKTICLAVSPSLKALGIPGRPRLFEVLEKVREINAGRAMRRRLTGTSIYAEELEKDPSLAVDFIAARPQMSHYLEVSSIIYRIYLDYVAPEDIHVYSVDEVFIDATSYLPMYKMDARGFASFLVREIMEQTGITATAGIGTNLYLCKVAMDIVAKHTAPDENGVRIASLDEQSYRERLWAHTPITDFWRIGPGYARKLAAHGMFTMGDVAQLSLVREDLFYDLFGVNAELLIDHAWGIEPCTIREIKAYTPQANSLSTGQVLARPYQNAEGALIVREMAEVLAMDLVRKGLMTDQVVLTVCYDTENLADPARLAAYHGAVHTDHYGRSTPKHAHGTEHLGGFTSSASAIGAAVMAIYQRTVDPNLTIRRVFVVAGRVLPEGQLPQKPPRQLDLFGLAEEDERREQAEEERRDREVRRQKAILKMQRRYAKNAILKGMNLLEGGTTRERNEQIGGHRA